MHLTLSFSTHCYKKSTTSNWSFLIFLSGAVKALKSWCLRVFPKFYPGDGITWVDRQSATYDPGGCYSMMPLNQTLSLWTLFWLGRRHSSHLAAQWWPLIKPGAVLWNLWGTSARGKEQKSKKRWRGRLARRECVVEKEIGGACREQNEICEEAVFVRVCVVSKRSRWYRRQLLM